MEASNRDRSASKAQSERRLFLIKISVLFFVCLAYFLGVYLWSVTVIQTSGKSAAEVTWAGRRQLAMKQILFYTRWFWATTNSTLRVPYYNQAAQWITYEQNIEQGLLFGDPTLGLPGSIRRIPALDELLFSDACFTGLEYVSSPGCLNYSKGIMSFGLDSAFTEYNRVAMFAINSYNATEAASLHTSDLDFLSTMELTYMRQALSQSIYLYRAYVLQLIDEYLGNRLVVMLMMLLVLAMLYRGLYIPLIARLQDDTLRTRAMLLVIPVKVMESVRSIRTYIRNNATKA